MGMHRRPRPVVTLGELRGVERDPAMPTLGQALGLTPPSLPANLASMPESRSPSGLPPEVVEALSHPMIRDTLWGLVGGEPTQRYKTMGSRNILGLGADPNTMATTSPDGSTVTYHKAMFDEGESRLNTIEHEAGHLFDVRGIEPSVVQEVKKHYPQWAREGVGYSRTNATEMFGDAFMNAVEYIRTAGSSMDGFSSRQSFDDNVGGVYMIIPGTRQIVDYLLKQPVYRDHVLNRSTVNTPTSNRRNKQRNPG